MISNAAKNEAHILFKNLILPMLMTRAKENYSSQFDVSSQGKVAIFFVTMKKLPPDAQP